MILEKIPRIECVLVIPELIEGELDNLIAEFVGNKKSLKILKKYKKRIKTYNYFKNILPGSKSSSEIIISEKIIQEKLEKIYNNTYISNEELFNCFIKSLDNQDKLILTKFIISHLDRIINKYIKILVHMDDQVFVLSKLNKDNKKIFLKFFLPKIKKDSESGENIFENSINSLKDNIHLTLLPTVEGHGLDGLFHLTFRIEGKKTSIFEYSKFASLNVDSDKLGIGIYPDEKCINGLIFKIIQNLSKLVESIKKNDFSDLDSNVLNAHVYNGMLEFISLDILNKLNITKKLEYIFEKYLHSLGKETIKSIIDKLFRIVILTFVELTFGLN
jgi:hypothetical protein